MRSVSRICPSWLSAQADDLVQAAMMRVMRILEQGERNRNLDPSYLWRVAYTATVDEIRRLRSRREVSIDTAEAADAASSRNPEREVYGQEIINALRDCLQRLVESRRIAVTLHLQGHSIPEAARLLGMGNKKVENLVYRGLADLRRCLRSKGLEP